MPNELDKVLRLIDAFREEQTTRRRFARKHRLHPSALSRILRVAELPQELLQELGGLPRLSRTHLEVVAAAPPSERRALVEQVRAGRSSYEMRARHETTRVIRAEPVVAAPPVVAPVESKATVDPRVLEVARRLGASPEEATAFAAELLLVLWTTGREKVEASFQVFRERRAKVGAEERRVGVVEVADHARVAAHGGDGA